MRDLPVWLIRLRLRLRALCSRGHDRELRDELELHVDLLTDTYVADGASPDEARARAHREFGNLARVHEASHELFGVRLIEGLGKDLSYAAREARRSPGFTAVAVISLAVGIGVATAAFALVDALMLRGLPVADPERLVAVSNASSATWARWTYAVYRQWAEASDAPFAAAAIYDLTEAEQPAIDGVAAARVSLVSGNYFEVLGVPALAGRPLGATDDHARRQVAVISHAFMERQFGTPAAVVGRTLVVNDVLFEVVGVARRGFGGDWVGQPTDVWLPLSAHTNLLPSGNALMETSRNRRLRVIARIKSGYTTEQAEVAANVLHQRLLASSSAETPRDRREAIVLLSAARGYAPLRQRYAQPLMIASVIVTLVLVVACANFTSLLYGRSRSRQQEFALRLVLGAGGWRIARQALVECVALASLAGVLALVVSSWGTTALVKQFAATIQPVELDAGFDLRVVMFAAACVGLVVLFGLVPSLAGSRLTASEHLARAALRERRGNSVGRAFLVAQLALCAVLLIGAGLIVRTVINLRSQSLGFDRNVLLVTLAPGQAGYTRAAAAMLLDRLRERLLAIRGVGNVSTTGAPLLDSRAYWVDGSDRLAVEGRRVPAGVRWTFVDVGPGFFETVGMPLVRGRGLQASDVNPPADVVVINQSLAKVLFGADDPVGRRVGMSDSAPKSLIVGVVNDARQTSPRDQGLAVMYRPLLTPGPQVVLAIRTQGPAAEFVDVVRHQLAAVDQSFPIVNVQTVEQILNAAIAQDRLLGLLAVGLGLLVIVVTCVGLHALVANDVAERTHELGIRMALGATRSGVAMLVLRESAMLVILSLCVGVPLSLGATRPLSSQLYGLQTDDPQTITIVVMLLLAVAFVAALLPARSAARVDPVGLLRRD